MFKTEVTEKLGIESPIIQAGMGGVARAELVAAVSRAGGLGAIGAAMMTPAILREQIRTVKDLTDKPFGVDLLLAQGWPGLEEMIQVMYEEEVPVFASGLGNPAPYAEEMHRHGMTVMAVVGGVRHARRVVEGGTDIVIAQGTEGGGHTGRIATMALVPQVVDAVAPVPVVAAGGVADGRGLVAALAPGGRGARGETSPSPAQMMVDSEKLDAATGRGNTDLGFMPAGQISGAIQEVKPAGEGVGEIMEGAEGGASR